MEDMAEEKDARIASVETKLVDFTMMVPLQWCDSKIHRRHA